MWVTRQRIQRFRLSNPWMYTGEGGGRWGAGGAGGGGHCVVIYLKMYVSWVRCTHWSSTNLSTAMTPKTMTVAVVTE